MKRPFPGMDPYLEDPTLWPGVHDKLIYNLVEALNETLPVNYVADIEHRLYVALRDRIIIPGIVTVKDVRSPTTSGISGGTATLSRADEPAILVAAPDEVSESFIEIRYVGLPKRVVTIIEMLSHSNKALGSAGRKSYLQKQNDVLSEDIHLVEVDLLRRGEHTVAAPYDRIVAELGRWDYVVSVSRGTDRTRFELYLRTLRDRLPFVRVPLDESDSDAELDLQQAFEKTYLVGAYPRLVDYRREPTPLLSQSDAAWADALLTNSGFRPIPGADA